MRQLDTQSDNDSARLGSFEIERDGEKSWHTIRNALEKCSHSKKKSASEKKWSNFNNSVWIWLTYAIHRWLDSRCESISVQQQFGPTKRKKKKNEMKTHYSRQFIQLSFRSLKLSFDKMH